MKQVSSEIELRAEIEKSAAVREMFNRIASRYDLLNHLLSLNIDKGWRRRVSKILENSLADSSSKILDVACGTGDLALELIENGKAEIIGVDFSRPMLEIAMKKTRDAKHPMMFFQADGLNLGFADGSFDAVTIAFGLRNFSNYEKGLIELQRVLKPGGRLIILECSAPVIPVFRELFNFYFRRIVPRIGGAISGSWGAYKYLPDSVAKFPDQKQLANLLTKTGYSDVEYTNLTGGIAAIHSGIK